MHPNGLLSFVDVVFELNGVKVHKSEVQKKTLSPVWNENVC